MNLKLPCDYLEVVNGDVCCELLNVKLVSHKQKESAHTDAHKRTCKCMLSLMPSRDSAATPGFENRTPRILRAILKYVALEQIQRTRVAFVTRFQSLCLMFYVRLTCENQTRSLMPLRDSTATPCFQNSMGSYKESLKL